MNYYKGLIEWESNGLKEIPNELLKKYINDLRIELEHRIKKELQELKKH